MRGLNLLLLCFFYALSKHSSFSISADDDEELNDLLLVTNATESSVTLEWRFVGCANFNNLTFQYQLREPIIIPESLVLVSNDTHFKIAPEETILERGRFENFTVAERLYPVPGNLSRSSIRVSNSSFLTADRKLSSLIIKVYDLKFNDMDYLFELIRTVPTGEANTTRYLGMTIADVIGRTQPSLPQDPPKTYEGCFQLSEVNTTHKLVKIFWRKQMGGYRVAMYRDFRPDIFRLDENRLDRGFAGYLVDLPHYRFVLQSSNAAGYSATSSVINVPAPEYLVPPLYNFYFAKVEGIDDTYELVWRELDNVVGYTVAWVSAIHSGDKVLVETIHDLVYLNGSATTFRLTTKHDDFKLAVSVNTMYSSSGLRVVARLTNGVPIGI